MTAIYLPARSFDAVAAFYSITHVPRSEHDHLLRRIGEWLKPGGLLVASLGADALPDWSGRVAGDAEFFSHYDAETNLKLLRDADFDIERVQVMDQDHDNARFLWVVARTPAGAHVAALEKLPTLFTIPSRCL